MTDLSQFSGSELELLASLPYKAGVFVSHADDVEGEADDEREMAALETCIKAIAKAHDGEGFTAAVMAQTLSMKDQWPVWAGQSFRVPDDAQIAASLLKAKVSEDEFKDFRRALLGVGQAVAEAHGEFGQFDDDHNEGGVFGAFVSKIVGGFSGGDHDAMNVSASEGAAIDQLRVSLQ